MSGNTVSLNASRHPYKPLSRAGSGLKNTILINLSDQCGVEPRDIYEPHFSPKYSQRVERSQRGLGAVPLDFFSEREFSPVLAIELGRALRRRDARKPSAEQEAQSQQSQHWVPPVQVSRLACVSRAAEPRQDLTRRPGTAIHFDFVGAIV
jgi:hypothetical protein